MHYKRNLIKGKHCFQCKLKQTQYQTTFKPKGMQSCQIYHDVLKLTHTSDKLVITCFEVYGSCSVSRSPDFVNSIKQSHCFSSSKTFVALRIITFRHLICKKQSTQTVKTIIPSTFSLQCRSWLQHIYNIKQKLVFSFISM